MSFIAAIIVGGGALLGGIVASKGSKDAASTQANAANTAAQVSQNEFNTITAQEQPFMNAGYGAQSQLNYLMGIPQTGGSSPAPSQPWTATGSTGTAGSTTPNGITKFGAWGNVPGGVSYQPPSQMGGPGTKQIPEAGMQGGGQPTSSAAGGYGSLITPFTADNFRQLSPAYQFQQQQGMQGVLNGDASGVGALSGAAMKDLVNYNQGLADTSFNTAFNQYQTQQGNIYSRLSDIANRGQNAAANTGQQGTSLAGQVAQSVTNAGSATAAGQVGSANAWSSAIGGLSSLPYLAGNSNSGNSWGAALGQGLNFNGPG